MLVYAVQQCESPQFYIYHLPLEPPSPHSSLPLWIITELQAGPPVLFNSLTLVICFINNSVYMSILLYQFALLSLFPNVSTSPCSMSVSPLLLCKQVNQYYVSRFHIYVLMYNTCFTLSNVLNFM